MYTCAVIVMDQLSCRLPRSIAVFRQSWKWQLLFTQSSYLSLELRSSSMNSSPPVSSPTADGQESRSHSASSIQTHSKFYQSRLSPLNIVQSRQFLTSDGMTIVCVHPNKKTPLEDTKPLRPFKPELARQRTSLTEEEVELVKKLRREDGSLWTINTLARFFNVKRVVISKVAPASLERQEELKKEEALMASMKFYKRKLYKAEREMRRQKRLEEIISQNEKLASIRAHHQNSHAT